MDRACPTIHLYLQANKMLTPPATYTLAISISHDISIYLPCSTQSHPVRSSSTVPLGHWLLWLLGLFHNGDPPRPGLKEGLPGILTATTDDLYKVDATRRLVTALGPTSSGKF